MLNDPKNESLKTPESQPNSASSLTTADNKKGAESNDMGAVTPEEKAKQLASARKAALKAQEIKKNTRMVILIGPVVGALYLLASLFPTFSAVIASLIIGVAVSLLTYGAYRLYVKGTQAVDKVTKVAHDFHNGKYQELTDQAKNVLSTSIVTLQTFNNSVNTIATELSNNSNNINGVLLQGQLSYRALTFKARQNIHACTYGEFQAKTVKDLRPKSYAVIPGYKYNNAYVAQAPNGDVMCTFLDDYDKQETQILNIKMTEPTIESFVNHNEKKILEFINTYIVGCKIKDRQETLNTIAPIEPEPPATPNTPNTPKEVSTHETSTPRSGP